MDTQILPRWQHQQETMERILACEGLFNTSDAGTGKTRAHIDAFAHRKQQGDTDVALIVCPRTLMSTAWMQDIKKFQPNLTVSLAHAANRKEALSAQADIYIINTDGVLYFTKHPEALTRFDTGKSTLIIDESTSFKTPSSQRSRAMATVAKKFRYRQALTGTPNPNSITELWHQIKLLDDGKRLGTSFYAFRNSVQTPIPQGAFTRWVDRQEALSTVAFLLKDLNIRFQFDDVMDVPPIYDRFIEFPINSKLRKIYATSQKEAEIVLGEDSKITPLNAAVFINKLLQLLSGAVYDVDGTYKLVDTSRYELIADLVEGRDHSVVFYSWVHQQKELTKLFDQRGITYAVLNSDCSDDDRNQLVSRFQDGDFRTILLHPKTGAHGLTLTRARTVIWASPRYEADYLKQGMARIRRGTQDKKTENIMLCAEDTVERDVYHRLNSKVDRMSELLTLFNL